MLLFPLNFCLHNVYVGQTVPVFIVHQAGIDKKKIGEEKNEDEDDEEDEEKNEDEDEEEEDDGAPGDIKLKKELGLFSAIALIVGNYHLLRVPYDQCQQ